MVRFRPSNHRAQERSIGVSQSSPFDAYLVRHSRHIPVGGGPAHAEGSMSLGWIGKTGGSSCAKGGLRVFELAAGPATQNKIE